MVILLLLLLGIPAWILNGWALSVLVRWFTDYSPSTVTSMGLILIAGLLVPRKGVNVENTDEAIEAIAVPYVAALFALLFGAVLHYGFG